MLSAALALALACHALAPNAEDLAKRYPGGKISFSGAGLAWSCTPEDVWELKSFELEFHKDFLLACGKSAVAIGKYETNVLWAVVFPEEPAHITAKGQPGDGETTRAILLRFAPAEIGRVFPSKTVTGPGPGWKRIEADRIFRHKLGYKWYTPAGNPTVVQSGFTLVDADTKGGKRRFYELDGSSGKVTYVADFEAKPLPPEPPIAKKEAEKGFGDVWEAFDREYANFVLLPKLKWDKVGADSRKLLADVETRFDLAAVLSDMLANLEDLHVWVKCGDDILPGYSRPRPLNASWKGSLAQIGSEVRDTEHDLVWSRTKDGIGYLNVRALEDEALPSAFDAALDELADTWGLVIDLRFNGGGGEDLAAAIAGRFVDQERVYSKNQYRIGPGHDQLGEVLERRFAPRGPWRYQGPVVALWGQKTMSSAESFALMLAQCPQVTTMGDRTAGSSANPRHLDLDCGITVNLPRWHDMDPAGKPIEHAGIQPQVKLDFPEEKFGEGGDPVLEAALAKLRKTPAGERKPGKR
jgi:hypothetical protein